MPSRSNVPGAVTAQGMARGIEQGIAAGFPKSASCCRLAARKFDEHTTARLAGLIAEIGDADALATWVTGLSTAPPTTS